MLTLAVDTATAHVCVAVGRDGAVLGELRLEAGRRHAEELVPAIRHLLAETRVHLDELAFLASGIGPGLFTGLRVGITTVRTLAQVLDVPVVGIPTLDLLAHPWRATNREVLALIDARRREVFSARYLPVPQGLQRDGDYAVGPPAAVVADVVARGADTLLVGDGAVAYAALFEGTDRVELAGPGAVVPSPGALVELATARYERDELGRPDDLLPLYLRRSDAEIVRDRS